MWTFADKIGWQRVGVAGQSPPQVLKEGIATVPFRHANI